MKSLLNQYRRNVAVKGHCTYLATMLSIYDNIWVYLDIYLDIYLFIYLFIY